jgi:glycosyltransferase involved in cell wall biosynthesis
MASRFALVTLNQIDPCFRDGGSRSALNYLRALATHGAQVGALSFVCADYPQIQITDARADPGAPFTHTAATCATRLRGVEFIETILPVNLAEHNARQAIIVQTILRALAQQRVEFVLTVGEGYVPLLAGWLAKLPGAHVFQSPQHIESFQRNAAYQTLLRTRHVIANSDWMRAHVERGLRVSAHTWHPPHDLAPFIAARTEPRTFAIGFSSSQGAVKGDDLVAEIIARVPEFRFIIAGGKFTRRDLGAPNVTYLGHVSQMQDFYRQIDVLIVPSLWQEAFGLVILEAAANGVPVIANRRGGIPEALGDSGVLIDFDPDQSNLGAIADEYARTIRRLLGDARVYENYRQAAFARAYKFEQEKEAQAQQMNVLFNQPVTSDRKTN